MSNVFYFFNIITKSENCDVKNLDLPVYTTEPYGIYGVSHIVISKYNLILKVTYFIQINFTYTLIIKTSWQHLDSYNENSFLDCYAINPLSGNKIPIYLNSNEDFGEKNADNKYCLDAKLG